MKTRIRSKFKKNESFDYLNVPKHFNSVTDGSIKSVKSYCLKNVTHRFKDEFNFMTFSAMLGAINGEFTPLYVTLEGDYSARKTNLQFAYSEGLATVGTMVEDVKGVLQNYNEALVDYKRAYYEATGKHLGDDLVYDKTRIDEIEKGINKRLEKESYDQGK